MEGQTQAGTDLVRWIDRKGQTARSLGSGRFVWRSDPLRMPRIQGTASGRQDDRFCPVQHKPPFPRSIDRVSTGARGAHQATAPSTQLVGCDGDWPACPALSVGTDAKVKPGWRTAWSVWADGRSNPTPGAKHGPLDR